MFRLHRSSKVIVDALSTSELYDEVSFYSSFIRDLRRAKTSVVIESPFIACKRTQSLLPVLERLCKSGVSIRVNTRNPNHHDHELRIQAWMSIKKLRTVGVRVKTYDDMRHRKLAVIDSQILWEGSLNIMSQSHSKEIMRRIDSEHMSIQMLKFTSMDRWFW